MGMNGAKGRARTLRSIRGAQRAEARAMGVDVENRPVYAAWYAERTRCLWAGLADRSRCGCGGDKHAIITKKDV